MFNVRLATPLNAILAPVLGSCYTGNYLRIGTRSVLWRIIHYFTIYMTGAFTPLLALSKRHLLAILFALFVGVFVVAPQLVFAVREGGHYRGLYMMMNTESEWYYLARMHEFYDEGKIGNPYLADPYKFNGPIFVSPGGETILAFPGKLLNISVPTMNLIYKFLLPAITFLLLYALIFRLTASSAWSIAGGLMFLVGSTWLYANNLSHLLRGDSSFFTEFVYNRAVHPQFDGVLFFLYLNVLLSALKEQRIRWFVLLGGLLGLSFYTYFYSFTFFLALNFVLALIWLYVGKTKEVVCLALATFGGFVLGIPALLAIYSAIHHPDYPQLLITTQPGHTPEISKNGLFISFLFAIYFFRNQAYRAANGIRDHALFLIGLLVTTFVVVNQQVLTGVSLYSGHYHHNFNIPIFIVVLMFLASIVSVRLEIYRPDLRIISRALPWIISLIFIATGMVVQYFSYVNDAPQASEDQRYVAALSWLDVHTPKESVVMTNEKLSNLIPIFTSNNVMWASLVSNYLISAERARFTPDNLLQSRDFLHDIKQYRVDYILWDKRVDPAWRIDRFNLPILRSGDDWVIYQLSE